MGSTTASRRRRRARDPSSTAAKAGSQTRMPVSLAWTLSLTATAVRHGRRQTAIIKRMEQSRQAGTSQMRQKTERSRRIPPRRMASTLMTRSRP